MPKGYSDSIAPLIATVGHDFADRRLAEQALTHPSAASPARPDNQRLEFLGDRVLGLVIAAALLDAYPDEAEGSLAPRYNALVRRETLAEIAAEIDLGRYLRLGRSESTGGGRRKSAILADALEALIAAIYLDGGMEAARRFVLAHWQERIERPALMTDGQPTFSLGCVGTGMTDAPVDVTPIIDEVRDARLEGIGTFVIGSPGSEQTSTIEADARPWLSFAAEAGGTAAASCSHSGPDYCHFDMVAEPDFGAGLRNALSEISGRIVQCDFALPEPPPGELLDPSRINVVFTSASGAQLLVLQSTAERCTDGWRYSADGTRIELCSRTCELVQAELGAKLELLFGCATVVR